MKKDIDFYLNGMDKSDLKRLRDNWKDGSDDDGIFGCTTKLPIMLCPYFKKMYEEEEKKRNLT